jgi:general secretion pathway protein D
MNVGRFAAIIAVALLAAVQTAGAQDQSVLIDFQDADLRTVIAALVEAGGLNVSYGELPARHVTLRMRQPVPKTDVLPLLRSLAQSNGLTVTEEGGLIRLTAQESAPRTPQPAPTVRDDSSGGELRLFVYRLKHARAAKLASTLQAIFGGKDKSGLAASTSNLGLSSPTLSDQLRGQQIGPTSAESAPSAPSPSANAAQDQSGSLPAQLHGLVQIVPDENTNSLLIRAQPADWDVVKQAVDAMDLRPLQVLIEVLIAEVSNTRDFELGISGTGTYTPRGTSSVRDSGALASAASNNFLLSLTHGGPVNINLVLQGISNRGHVRVISRPLIFAENNQEAKILVGSQRPFIQVSQTQIGGLGQNQVVQYRDVGTSLTILPTINPDGYVNLQLQQEVSTATTETEFGAPVISTREASTHLFVRDGHTVVLGGLTDHEINDTKAGIPILSEIPLIGALFGTTQHTTTNSELFLFLTPHIVSSDEDADRLRSDVDQHAPIVKAEPTPDALLTPRPSPAPEAEP